MPAGGGDGLGQVLQCRRQQQRRLQVQAQASVLQHRRGGLGSSSPFTQGPVGRVAAVELLLLLVMVVVAVVLAGSNS